MKINNYFTRLKKKWGVENNRALLIILVVFALTGSTVVLIADLILPLTGVTAETPLYNELALRLLIIFPVYQGLLLLYGYIFGQFQFFWDKEKKLFGWLFTFWR